MAFTPSENPITNPTRESYTELRPFRFWCQKVLPLVYDDSLSYYELLCKVVDYLNKTMEDVDHMNTDMDTLYSNFQQFQEGTIRIYNELVAYVNTYFDELDVQEEINSKLDEMASNGDLTALIAPLVPDIVREWLDEHITPTTPLIDKTLSIADAGADSETVGKIIATLYNPNNTYAKNSYVLYDGKLYKSLVDIDTAESWTASHWILTSVTNEAKSIKDSLSLKENLNFPFFTSLGGIPLREAFTVDSVNRTVTLNAGLYVWTGASQNAVIAVNQASTVEIPMGGKIFLKRNGSSIELFACTNGYYGAMSANERETLLYQVAESANNYSVEWTLPFKVEKIENDIDNIVDSLDDINNNFSSQLPVINQKLDLLTDNENILQRDDVASNGGLSTNSKWVLAKVSGDTSIDKLAVNVKANTTSFVTLEIWELNNSNEYVKVKDILPSYVEPNEVEYYTIHFDGFLIETESLLVISDSSSGGLVTYYIIENYSTKRFSKTATSITYSQLTDTPNVKIAFDLYYTQKQKNVVVVDANGKGNYLSVIDAVNNEPENTVIYVLPGVYEGTIQAFEKRVIIIGSDKNTCILKSTDGRYAFPAINCSCGYIENVTITCEYVNGVSNEIGSDQNGAYALHCENEYGVGNVLELHHCTLKSDFAPAIGAGLRKDFNLILDDCDLTNNQIINRGNYTSEGSLGALYIHDSNGEQGKQYVIVKDCVLKSSLGKTLTLYQVTREQQNNKVYCDFINNVLFDTINRYSNNVWLRNRPFESNVFSINIGYGNSNSTLNN